MSLQQYLNQNVLATIDEDVIGTTSSISILSVSTTTAKDGEQVLIISRGTGRKYNVTLSADINAASTDLKISSTTFDSLIPIGSIVVQKQQNKFESIFRKNTSFTFSMNTSRIRSLNDHCRITDFTNAFISDIGVTLANGSTVDADFASEKSVFIVPPNGAKVEHITYSATTTQPTGSNFEVLLFELPIALNSNTAQTISLIAQESFTSPNDATKNLYGTSKPLHNMAANTCILPVFRQTGTLSTNTRQNIMVSILISYDPRI